MLLGSCKQEDDQAVALADLQAQMEEMQKGNEYSPLVEEPLEEEEKEEDVLLIDAVAEEKIDLLTQDQVHLIQAETIDQALDLKKEMTETIDQALDLKKEMTETKDQTLALILSLTDTLHHSRNIQIHTTQSIDKNIQ